MRMLTELEKAKLDAFDRLRAILDPSGVTAIETLLERAEGMKANEENWLSRGSVLGQIAVALGIERTTPPNEIVERARECVAGWRASDGTKRLGGAIPPKPASTFLGGYDSSTPTCREAVDFLGRVQHVLIEKNAKYGDSAANPIRVFSKASPIEQLFVRLDDKLSRLKNMGVEALSDEDTLADLVGYAALLAGVRFTTKKEAGLAYVPNPVTLPLVSRPQRAREIDLATGSSRDLCRFCGDLLETSNQRDTGWCGSIACAKRRAEEGVEVNHG